MKFHDLTERIVWDYDKGRSECPERWNDPLDYEKECEEHYMLTRGVEVEEEDAVYLFGMYMRLAVNGIPSKDFHYYLPYFINMSCEHCIYNGRACSHPETDDVCIDYRVERKHKEREKSKRKQK